jgi:hypothetical protein
MRDDARVSSQVIWLQRHRKTNDGSRPGLDLLIFYTTRCWPCDRSSRLSRWTTGGGVTCSGAGPRTDRRSRALPARGAAPIHGTADHRSSLTDVANQEITMKVTPVLVAALLFSAGAAMAQGSSGSSGGATGSGASSSGPAGASPSSPSSPSAAPAPPPSSAGTGQAPQAGPNAQSNPYQPGTTGQGPAVNPANPQDRTTRPNPQDLSSPTGRNPQDMNAPASGVPNIMREERR